MRCTSISLYNECYTPAVWDYPNITRPFSIIYYALGGCAYYSIDGKERPFRKDHLYILPANKVFSLREDARDKFYSVYIHAFTSPEIDSVIDIDVSKDVFIKQTLELVRVYARDNNEIYIRKLTDMLLSYISETFRETEQTLPSRIKNYIDGNFVEVFKENGLSRHFNYSKSHISKVFKEKYNVTPKQYAKRLILKEALVLLYKGLSVKEISDMLYFSSPENLSRFFKSCYGYSPTEYKKRFKDISV